MRLSRTKVIVVGLFSAREPDPQAALIELAQRVEAHGGSVGGQLLQRRGVSRDKRPGGSKRMDHPLSPTTLIGRGKAQELAELCRSTSADLVLFRNLLSERQRSHLEELCATRVHDAATLGLAE